MSDAGASEDEVLFRLNRRDEARGAYEAKLESWRDRCRRLSDALCPHPFEYDPTDSNAWDRQLEEAARHLTRVRTALADVMPLEDLVELEPPSTDAHRYLAWRLLCGPEERERLRLLRGLKSRWDVQAVWQRLTVSELWKWLLPLIERHLPQPAEPEFSGIENAACGTQPLTEPVPSEPVRSAQDQAPDPCAILDSLVSEAEARRRQEDEARRITDEHARRLREHAALRERLAEAFDRAYAFPSEETRQGRKPCPDGFRRWAEQFLALALVLRECDEAIEGLDLAKRLRTVAGRIAPAAMNYACALLLIAAEGKIDTLASALEKANGDGELRRFVLWLPFILDNLWHPFPGEDGLIRVAESPDGTSQEENQQAEQAFGWRPLGFPAEDGGNVIIKAGDGGPTGSGGLVGDGKSGGTAVTSGNPVEQRADDAPPQQSPEVQTSAPGPAASGPTHRLNEQAAKPPASDLELPLTLSEDFVASLSGQTQRKLLRAVNGRGRVQIADVLSVVYGSRDTRKIEALLKAKDRVNRTLAEKNAGCELRREGETLILSRL